MVVWRNSNNHMIPPCPAVVDGALRAGYANVCLCIVATEPKAKEPHAHH